MIGKEPLSNFKELRPEGISRTDLAAVDIIFVHGLDAKRTTALRRSLKGWLRELNKTTKGRIWVFGFDAAELVTEGKERFILLADDLHKNVQQIRGTGRFIFIGHSLAGWVVEETLARYTAAKIAWNTAGVILLGLPSINDQARWDKFSTSFLDGNSKVTKRRRALEVSLLKRVDANFQSLRESRYGPDVVFIPLSTANGADNADAATRSSHRGIAQVVYRPHETRQTAPEEKEMGSVRVPVRTAWHLSRRLTKDSESYSSNDSNNSETSSQQLLLPNVIPGDSTHEKVIAFISEALAHEKHEPEPGPPGHQSNTLQTVSTDTQVQSQPSDSMVSEASRYSVNFLPDNILSLSGNILRNSPVAARESDPDFPLAENVYVQHSNKSDEEGDFLSQVKSVGELRERRGNDVGEVRESSVSGVKELLRLAALYQQSGELQKSKNIYEVARTVIERDGVSIDSVGVDYIKCQIAVIGLLEGHFREAGEAFEALEKKLRSIFQEHERTWEVVRWLAVSLDMQGKYGEALEKLAQIPKAKDTTISESYTPATNVTLLAQSTLALVLGHLGDNDGALDNSQKALSRAEDFIEQTARGDAKGMTRLDENEESACVGRMLSVVQSDRAKILTHVGQYDEACHINDQALKCAERYFGDKYVATLDCWSLKAYLLALEGKVDEAETQCQRTLKAMRRYIGKEHPSTLKTLGVLVFIYKSQAKLADALQNATYLVKKNRDSYDIGPRHPQTISSMAQLADVYLAHGKVKEALSSQKTVVELSEQVLGKHHPRTLSYRSSMASILCSQENWNTAKDILRQVFAEQYVSYSRGFSTSDKDRMGIPHVHPSGQGLTAGPLDDENLRKMLRLLGSKVQTNMQTYLPLASTVHCLGISERERENGNLELARELLAEVAEYRQDTLGPVHPDTVSSQLELAITDRKLSVKDTNIVDLGRLTATLKDFEKIVIIRGKILGADHPDTLSARRELGVTMFQLGFLEEAANEQEIVLQQRNLLLGKRHPKTVGSCIDLSNVYQSMGRLDEAESLQLDALRSQIDSLPPPRLVGEAKKSYQSALEVLGLNPVAEGDSPLPEIIDSDFSENDITSVPQVLCHHQIISSMAALASIYAQQEKFDLAAIIQEAVVSQRKHAHAEPSNVNTLESTNSLALIYQARGNFTKSMDDFEKAVQLYNEVYHNASKLSPLYFASQSLLGSLYFSMDNFLKAEAIQSQAYDEQIMISEASESDNPEALVIATFNLALTEKELGKKDKALQLMEKAREVSQIAQLHTRTAEILDTLREWRDEHIE